MRQAIHAAFKIWYGSQPFETLPRGAYLVVLDNLEAVPDIELLVDRLRLLVKPSKILLTTRESRYEEGELYHYRLPELNQTDALQLIRSEAKIRNIQALMLADDEELVPIHATVGGITRTSLRHP